MKKSGKKNVHLVELQRYVFTGTYVPQLSPSGEHELSFKTAEGNRTVLHSGFLPRLILSGTDAKSFLEQADDLALRLAESDERR